MTPIKRCVTIESPYAGDMARNEIYLQRCIRDCLERGESPYASHQMLTGALDDTVLEQRQLGIDAGLAMSSLTHMSVFYVDYGMSTGMVQALEQTLNTKRAFVLRRIGANP